MSRHVYLSVYLSIYIHPSYIIIFYKHLMPNWQCQHRHVMSTASAHCGFSCCSSCLRVLTGFIGHLAWIATSSVQLYFILCIILFTCVYLCSVYLCISCCVYMSHYFTNGYSWVLHRWKTRWRRPHLLGTTRELQILSHTRLFGVVIFNQHRPHRWCPVSKNWSLNINTP